MYRKSDIEMERAKVIKISRALIRLRHSVDIDQEINDVLPATLEEFDAALNSGDLKALTLAQLRALLDA